VHVVFTLLMFALTTAYRLECEREAMGGEPVGWQRWRRQLWEQNRDKVIVFAHGYYGILGLLPRSCEILLEEGIWQSTTPKPVSFPSAHSHFAPEDTTQ
jgi:hypothetical protein